VQSSVSYPPKSDARWLVKAIKTEVAAIVARRVTSSEASGVQKILDPVTKSLVPKDTAAALLQAAVRKCCDRGILAVQDQQQGSGANDDNITIDPVFSRKKVRLEFVGQLQSPAVDARLASEGRPTCIVNLTC